MTRALIVVDVQGQMAVARDPGQPWANPGAESAIAALIARFRAKGLPVIHVPHNRM